MVSGRNKLCGVKIFALLLTVLAARAGAQAPAFHPGGADSLLQKLVGSWLMTGDVRGKPVGYNMTAQRVLGDRYIELHMIDTAKVPQYEARVFIGADTLPDRIIVHWMDSFGAAYSIPYGTGTAHGDSIVFDVPYPDGAFRDTFVFNRTKGTWHFLLEGNNPTAGWKRFAEYDLTHR